MPYTPAPSTFLPLTSLSYFVLLVLADGPQHGYVLVQRIQECSDGLVNPGTGSFYSIVRKNVDLGLVTEGPGTDESGRRRVFTITALGRRVLAAEADRLAALARDAHRALLKPSRAQGR